VEWGDKGCEYRPDKCKHESGQGCEWCCIQCNTDTHWCPGCGTVTDHNGLLCIECEAQGLAVREIDYSTIFESNDDFFVHYEVHKDPRRPDRIILMRIVRENAPLNSPVVWSGPALDIAIEQLPAIVEQLIMGAIS
jgi:hypothetical protein